MILKFFVFELKKLLKRKGNIAFIVLLPVAIVLVFSFILRSYMTPDVNFFNHAVILYSPAELRTDNEEFAQFADRIESDMDIEVTSAASEEEGKHAVDQQKAAAWIGFDSQNGYRYYASEYMEQDASKLIRVLFGEMVGKESAADITETEILNVERTNANEYFVFAETGFVILFLAIIFGLDIFNERENKTLSRIIVSRSSLLSYIGSKMLLALLAGILQVVIVHFISATFLHVSWGADTGKIYIQYALIAMFTAAFGVFAALLVKNKTRFQQVIIVVASLFGFLGGSFAPISTLENMKLVSYCIKISPLYWTNKSLIELHKGIMSSSYYVAIIIWGVLALAFTILSILMTKKEETAR